ncbi:GGDEF domain-containing protein [Campylobacter pinnipediorum]|uniref:GGDEF domain-containing protein n=1 Tax=Campylobacter pinnipediorum TaxID=1965231 RepID=UPI00084D3978|nr:GGDEF domain-containing protein [Campylobacter pinnipediorum]AQW85242.1 diguanylate cyclase [Campylobacter pinnipediorum subsp. pinnipediorum]
MAAISMAQIIKESISEIKNRQLMLTPENYTEVFNEISNKYGFTTETQIKLEKYISRLTTEYKTQANNLNINTIDEFIAFLTARLNRASQQSFNISEDLNFRSLVAFTKRILQTISIFHNKDAKSLAEKSIQLLNKKFDIKNIDKTRKNWLELIDSYNEEYLEFLKYYGVKNFNDLKSMMGELSEFLTLQNNQTQLALITDLIAYTLKPSISKELENDISELSLQIKKNPICIHEISIQNDIRNLITKRIEADKDEITEKFSTLNVVLQNISDKISNIATTSHTNLKKAQDIKNNISGIKFDVNNFEKVRDTLFDIANTLEVESRELGTEMVVKQETILQLQEKVTILEKELEDARAESKEDFLTKTASRRALMQEILRIEEAFKRYGTNYSLCFLDIDYFKKINDNYGHDAGDAILSTVAKIFKKSSRKIDFIGRYGGEEFVIILPNTNLNDAIKFANKIILSIEKFKFIYKNEVIKVTISAGVATRNLNENDTCTLENADKMLYSAKKNGRNQAMPKITE